MRDTAGLQQEELRQLVNVYSTQSSTYWRLPARNGLTAKGNGRFITPGSSRCNLNGISHCEANFRRKTMTPSFTRSLTLSVAALAVTLSSGLAGAADYPTKPITMYIGFRPGGAVDTTGRIIADKLAKILGQPVVAVTKAGGGGTVMATQLRNAAADGYTIGMGASAAYTLTPQLNKNIKYKIDDFTHLATLTYPSDAIVVKADSPWKTLKDLIDAHKKANKPISFATQVSASRLMCMAITEKSGVQFRLIPVKGGAVGIQEVLGGHIDATWSGSGWTEQVRAGKLRALATMSAERMKDYPNLPTLIELGYNFTFTDTFMLSAPKGVPAAVVAKLEAAIKQAINDPQVQKTLHDKIKLLTKYRNSKETLAFLHKQHNDIAPLVKKLK
jgi:putative tricarboxylic transport membrane protein